MKIGQLVWIPHLKKYGHIQELNWDNKRIKSVRVFNPDTGKFDIMEVLQFAIEAVTLIESLFVEVKSFIKKYFGKK